MEDELADLSGSDPAISRRTLLTMASIMGGAFALSDILLQPSSAWASPVWVAGWMSPLNNGTPSVNSEFLEGAPGMGDYDGGHNYHLGLDLNASFGDPVYAIGDGVVIDDQTGDYEGHAFFVKHTANDGTEFTVVYGHVIPSASGNVVAGQQIATVGWHHLHFGLRTIVSSDPRWGAWALNEYPFTNNFTEPRAFLTAHPKSSTVAGPQLGAKMSVAIAQSVRSGVGLFYLYVSPTRVTLSPELSVASAADRLFQDNIMRAIAAAAGYGQNYVPPVINDSTSGGWFLRNQIANVIAGMPTNYALSPTNPYNAP